MQRAPAVVNTVWGLGVELMHPGTDHCSDGVGNRDLKKCGSDVERKGVIGGGWGSEQAKDSNSGE